MSLSDHYDLCSSIERGRHKNTSMKGLSNELGKQPSCFAFQALPTKSLESPRYGISLAGLASPS